MPEVSQTKKITVPQAKRKSGTKKSKISMGEWGLVIGILAFIDLIELILGLFAIGEVVNTFIDWVVGPSLAFYLWARGEDLSSKGIASLAGSFVLELIPFINDLPLWTLDGLYLMSQSRFQNKKAETEEKEYNETQKLTAKLTAMEQRNRVQTLQAKMAAQEVLDQVQQEQDEAEKEASAEEEVVV